MWRWFSESQLQVRRCLRLPQVSFVVYTWQCCVDNDTVRRLGVTFDQFVCLGRCNGAVVEAHRASDISLQHFRSTVIAICSQQPTEKTSFLVSRLVESLALLCALRFARLHRIISYCRGTFGQTGDGHWSPVGGYHAGLDMVCFPYFICLRRQFKE